MIFLACPPKYIVALVPGFPLSHVGVMSDSQTSREELVALFASLRETTVPLLAFSSFDWTSRIDKFPFVAQNMSHLRQSCFNHFQPSVGEQEIWAKEMNEILPCLKDLLLIEINWFTPPEITPALLDNDLDTLTRWGHLCPSLEICRMPCKSP
ncbi:hypothetical protein BDZ94DRAFT_420921 [Collybia nuda]|uniref:Uncharacterized protein n=1 Tax=Collybia nuda TaxID=64659 RepID=A0A9P6CCP5_9AGAR|nr:hypothetical protein BDZ94DRAFT_420921 [Collybia nuda]